MRRTRRLATSAGCRGSILLEVIVATLLVGVLVVPLATAFSGSINEARRVRQRIQEQASGSSGSVPSLGREWGPRVIAAWWRPGPVLHVRVSGDAGQATTDPQVGLWVDGWMVTEDAAATGQTASAAGTNDLQTGPQQWNGLTGCELVIRARAAGEPWGPPWRLAVPEAAGGTPDLGSALAGSQQGPTGVVHRPGIGNSSLSASWSFAPLTSSPLGLIFSLAPGLQGWGGVTLDERSQWWWMEGGRSVDIYF